jgi:hypothetical protein
MEIRLCECLNAFVLSHNNTPDSQEQEQMRRSLRDVTLKSAHLRVVNQGSEPKFEEEANVTHVAFTFEGKQIKLVRIRTDLRHLEISELLWFDYGVGDVGLTARTSLNHHDHLEQVEIYFEDDRL